MAVVQDKDKSAVMFGSIKMKSEISKVGNLDWDRELMHRVRRKPRGMAEMRVDMRVLIEDQKHWHPDKRLNNYWLDMNNKSGRVSHMKCVPDTGAMVTSNAFSNTNHIWTTWTCTGAPHPTIQRDL